MKGANLTSANLGMSDTIKRSRSVPMSSSSKGDAEQGKPPPGSRKRQPAPSSPSLQDAIPTPPLTDTLLRALVSPPFLLSLLAFLRLSWSQSDLLHSFNQALAASSNVCTIAQTSLLGLQSVPVVALQSVLSTATASIHSSVESLASSASFAIHLARGVLVQFAASQTRLWRCLVDMVLRATQGVLASAVTDAKTAWNAGIRQLISDVNGIIDVLNAQLLSNLGAEFDRIFGTGGTITNKVAIPRINDIFVGSLAIPEEVSRAFAETINGIPSVTSLLDELEAMLARPLDVLADQVKAQLSRVADGLSMSVPQIELDQNWLALEQTEAWQVLSKCASGEWSRRAMQEVESAVRGAFAWYLSAALILGVGTLVGHILVEVGGPVYLRWRLQPVRLAKWQLVHVQVLPWMSPAAGMAWYKSRPVEYQVVKTVLCFVQWTRRVRRQPSTRAGGDQVLARYLVRLFAFLTHRPTAIAILAALAAQLVISTQLHLLDNPSTFTAPACSLTTQLAPVLLAATNTTLAHLDIQLTHYAQQIDTDLALASQYLSQRLAAPLIDSLAAINVTLADTTATIQATVGSLLSPVPILQTNVQALVQCIAGRYVEILRDLVELASRATTVSVRAEWRVAHMAKAQAIAAAARVVGREVEERQVGKLVDAVVSRYRERLAMEQRVAWVAFGVAALPVVLGCGLLVLEALMDEFVGWRGGRRSGGPEPENRRRGSTTEWGLSYLNQLKLLRTFRSVVHWYSDQARAAGDRDADVLERVIGVVVAVVTWPVAVVAGIGVAIVSRL